MVGGLLQYPEELDVRKWMKLAGRDGAGKNAESLNVMALVAAINAAIVLLRDVAGLVVNSKGQELANNAVVRDSVTKAAPLSPELIAESVSPDSILCLEDGVRVKSLTTYLKRFNLTPAQYKEKWGLPPSYPMVAQSLSEKRSAIARRTKPHLRRKRG